MLSTSQSHNKVAIRAKETLVLPHFPQSSNLFKVVMLCFQVEKEAQDIVDKSHEELQIARQELGDALEQILKAEEHYPFTIRLA